MLLQREAQRHRAGARPDSRCARIETRRIQNEALREVFDPLPSTQLHGTLAVTAGLKAAVRLDGRQPGRRARDHPDRRRVRRPRRLRDGPHPAGGRVAPAQQPEHHLPARPHARRRSTTRSRRSTAAARSSQRYRNDPDQEVKDYCTGADRPGHDGSRASWQQLLKRCLGQGSFIFRGETTAVESLDHDLLEAAKKHLAERRRAGLRPLRRGAGAGRDGPGREVPARRQPQGRHLGDRPAGPGAGRRRHARSINTDHKALVSIRDYIDRNGTVEGKRLIEHFSRRALWLVAGHPALPGRGPAGRRARSSSRSPAAKSRSTASRPSRRCAPTTPSRPSAWRCARAACHRTCWRGPPSG